LFKVLFINSDVEEGKKIIRTLVAQNFICDQIIPNENLDEEIVNKAPDAIILAFDNLDNASSLIQMIRELSKERPIPVLALISKESLKSKDILFSAEDFAITPCEADEIVIRLERVLRETYAVESKDLIRCGHMVIDISRREVTLEGKPLSLTFTEYELLKFLAANRGRVFTREALLNKIWGYDYYGGDRTVDVHIRRLRAKIDWGKQNFIETVRGVGYRLKKDT
jgi:two-component system alkaline phosphatase synthesis response regulator PhoP